MIWRILNLTCYQSPYIQINSVPPTSIGSNKPDRVSCAVHTRADFFTSLASQPPLCCLPHKQERSANAQGSFCSLQGGSRSRPQQQGFGTSLLAGRVPCCAVATSVRDNGRPVVAVTIAVVAITVDAAES